MQETPSLRGAFLPKKFFIVAGSATSAVSPLNAFDAALTKAGIGQCNLVNVSSILPPDAEETKNSMITPGTITFAVMARMDGDPGETIGAGIGWISGLSTKKERYGLVAEAHGYKDKEAIEKELKSKLSEMTKIRDLKIEKMDTRAEFIEVPKGKYGAVIVALVYAPWTEEESRRQLPNNL